MPVAQKAFTDCRSIKKWFILVLDDNGIVIQSYLISVRLEKYLLIYEAKTTCRRFVKHIVLQKCISVNVFLEYCL